MRNKAAATSYGRIRRTWGQIALFDEVNHWKSGWFKVFWITVSLLLLIGCGNEIISLVTRYLDRPKATQITVVKNLPNFPYVSVCSYSRLDQRKIAKYDFTDDFVSYLQSAYYGTYLAYSDERFNDSYLNVLQGMHDEFVTDHMNGTWSTADFFLEHSATCEDMLIYCQFEAIDFNCSLYATRWLGSTGPCCEIHAPFVEQRLPGELGGLQIAIEVEETVYTKTVVYSNPDAGYRVHIIPRMDAEQVPEDAGMGMDAADRKLTDAGLVPVNVLPGSRATISLHATRHKFLPKHGSCMDGVTLKYSNQYSYKACIQECIVNLTLSRCGCVQMGILFVDRSLLCDPHTAASCVQPLYQLRNSTTNMSLADELILMACDCPYPCTYWDYPMNIGNTKVPNRGYEKKLKEWYPHDDVKSYSIINIYFDFMVHTEYLEMETQTYTEFVSFFGGQMSLWLGVRIVTVVQLVVYGLHYMLCSLQPKIVEPVDAAHVDTKDKNVSADQATIYGCYDQDYNSWP